MGRLGADVTLDRLLAAYEQGLLTDAELYDLLLARAAEEEDASAYLDHIPECHRRGFATAIETHATAIELSSLDGIGIHNGFDPPPDAVVRQL